MVFLRLIFTVEPLVLVPLCILFGCPEKGSFNGFSGSISGFLQIFLEIYENFCYDNIDLHQLGPVLIL